MSGKCVRKRSRKPLRSSTGAETTELISRWHISCRTFTCRVASFTGRPRLTSRQRHLTDLIKLSASVAACSLDSGAAAPRHASLQNSGGTTSPLTLHVNNGGFYVACSIQRMCSSSLPSKSAWRTRHHGCTAAQNPCVLGVGASSHRHAKLGTSSTAQARRPSTQTKLSTLSTSVLTTGGSLPSTRQIPL